MALRASHLKKSYRTEENEVKALDGVSLEVGKGELVSVHGPSGCGKTTLLLVCGGLLHPDHGRVVVGDTDLYHLSLDERAERRATTIGFVFQQFYLVPYLSVLENVLIPTLGAPPSRASERRARELVGRFGLMDRMDHKPAELSTGERQRVALARALVNKPVVLFADEPTGNLDDDNSETVLRYIARFADEGGSVLLVSHDRRIAVHAHHSYAMRDGKFLET
jgi:putative ABC transport system ATP-binding protein